MFWLVWLGIGLYGMIPIVIFVLTLKIYIKNVETEKRIKKITTSPTLNFHIKRGVVLIKQSIYY